jgi:hypothetical protein
VESLSLFTYTFMFHSYLEILLAMIFFVVITNLAPQLLLSFVVRVYVRPINPVIQRPGHMQNALPIQLTKWSPTDSFWS